MGKLMDSLVDLRLDELLNTPPPGLDEAIAISKVVEFVESEEYARFTRIVFDTAPTGHTLRMLTLPDFVAATLAKAIRLQSKLGAGGQLIQALFGAQDGVAKSIDRLKMLEQRVQMVSRLFRCGCRICYLPECCSLGL
jgi:arsenite/tail-anchored protein-transporting ATPase